MDRSDYICEHLNYLKDRHYKEADVAVYKCKRINREFDEFHDICIECEYDSAKE